jgi:hypothetical protein
MLRINSTKSLLCLRTASELVPAPPWRGQNLISLRPGLFQDQHKEQTAKIVGFFCKKSGYGLLKKVRENVMSYIVGATLAVAQSKEGRGKPCP